MREQYDIIVVGAGPAGMAAAIRAAEKGAKTLVLDEQATPGGQIYRAMEQNGGGERPELGASYYRGKPLVEAFRQNGSYLSGATVWQVTGDGEVGYSHEGRSTLVKGSKVILATGAQERPMPIPGWTLPGVMGVGAAQILLKESEFALENAIFVGTGPLFFLVLYQYLQTGIKVRAAIDLSVRQNRTKALRHLLPAALAGGSELMQGLKWRHQLAKSGIPLIGKVEAVEVTGSDHATGIRYQKDGKWQEIESEHVLLHQGVVPNVNISLAAGCDSQWNERQACWTIAVDEWYRTSQKAIVVAGDGASINGAIAAEMSGVIAALGALHDLGRIKRAERDEIARPFRKGLARQQRIRPFLETLFRPARRYRIPTADKTIVCRCEEVSVATIREAAAYGCAGPNQLKSYSRCGMGPCQGRMCGLTVSELLADIAKKPVSETGYYRLRQPVKPLLLGELAALEGCEAQEAEKT